MRFRDVYPGSRFYPSPDPTTAPKEGDNFFVLTCFVATNIVKLLILF